MNTSNTPQKSPRLEEFPSSPTDGSVESDYQEIRRRVFEAFGWTHWTKCPYTGFVDGVPPGGTPPLKGSRGDLTSWPDPLYNAWGSEALEAAIADRGLGITMQHGMQDCPSYAARGTCEVSIRKSDTEYWLAVVTATAELNTTRRRRRALLDAAWQFVQSLEAVKP